MYIIMMKLQKNKQKPNRTLFSIFNGIVETKNDEKNKNAEKQVNKQYTIL